MPIAPQTRSAKPSLDLVPEMIELLESGEVVILPTDTSYVIAAHAFNRDGIAKIGQLKGWTELKPLALLMRREQASNYGDITPECDRLMAEFPCPVTVLVRKKDSIPASITGGFNSLMMFCPDNFTYELADRLPFPLACTTAGLSGDLKAYTFEAAMRLFEGKVPLIVDGGRSRYSRSATLVDFTVEMPAVLKYGPLSVDDLRPIVPNIQLPSHMRK